MRERHQDTRAPQARRVLLFSSAMHVWNDAFFALLYPLLPFIALDLGLSYTQTGMLRTAFVGASGILQIPAGFLAERWSEFWLLVGGNLWVSLGLLSMGLAPTYLLLLAATFVGGLGGGPQHPVASSMVSRAYEGPGSATAIGTVNFAGDLGKMAGPAVAAALAIAAGWRSPLLVVGGAGIAFMALSAATRRAVALPSGARAPEAPAAQVQESAPAFAFAALCGVGMLDGAVRGAALTFLPFVLADKGLGAAAVSVLFTLLFAGGAAGKLACGWLGDRVGSLGLVWATKGMTAALLLAMLPLPPKALVPLVAVFGFGLNGTSSVLYAQVARMTASSHRGRRFGFFYSATEVATAVAPLLYGLLADAAGLPATMVVMAGVTLLILPASLTIRRYL